MIRAAADDAPTTRDALEASARAEDAIAALRVRASRSGVEVWIMDRITAKTVLREVVLSTGDDESAVAVGAVELLRASLLEVEQPGFRKREVAPSPAVSRLVAAPQGKTGRLALALGPAAALSPGGLGVTPHVDVWLRFEASDHFALFTRVVLPTLPATLDAPEGRATVTLSTAAVGADALLFSPESAVRGRAGVGVGAVWAHMEGTAAQAFVGRGDDVVAALVFAHVGGHASLGRHVRVFADVSLGIASPRPVVRFAARNVGAWGEPVAIASVGLELPLVF